MFGSKFIQYKSQLTLFDICNLLSLDGIVVRHEQDSFVPAPFSHMGLVLSSFALYKTKNNAPPLFGPFHTLKTESSAVNASQSLCLTVEDLISTGAPSKGYVCLCLRVSLSMSARVCTVYV